MTGNAQGRMDASFEGGQGPVGAVASWKKKYCGRKSLRGSDVVHANIPMGETENI